MSAVALLPTLSPARTILRPTFERLMDCEEALRALRRSLERDGEAVSEEAFAVAIDGVIAQLVAARALGTDPIGEVARLGAQPSPTAANT